MKIANVNIRNGQGQQWWDSVKSRPDEPLIVAEMTLVLSWNEYVKLLAEDQDVRRYGIKWGYRAQ